MQVSDFHFDLPHDLIARYPNLDRSSSRLLQLNGDTGVLQDGTFTDVLNYIQKGDLVILNNTRVIPAQMFGRKESGGKLEVLVERILDQSSILAHVRSSKSPKVASTIFLGDNDKYKLIVTQRHDALFELEFCGDINILDALNDIGHMPLPPYIDRADEDADKERYQTVYNERPGAVAAPTAGLHFDIALLKKIKAKGATIAYVTLHVGAGTFQPVKVQNILDHHMHLEYAEVTQDVIDAILETKKHGGNIIAVGTTSVRSLETVAQNALANKTELTSFFGDTNIFIYPGYKFLLVDCLITNFHLPESTLIMLVSAFAGFNHTMQAYKHAVDKQYRFFSYGDAMFITKKHQ